MSTHGRFVELGQENAENHIYEILSSTDGSAESTTLGWAATGPTKGTLPLFTFYHPSARDSLYTTDWSEVGEGDVGYGYRGVVAYVYTEPGDNRVPVYRYWDQSVRNHRFRLTPDAKGIGTVEARKFFLLKSHPREISSGDEPVMTPTNFDGIEFNDAADFTDRVFEEPASFANCVFNDIAVFSRTTFEAGVTFSGAHFKSCVIFDQCVFGSRLDAARAKFDAQLLVSRSKRTGGGMGFVQTHFQGDVVLADLVLGEDDPSSIVSFHGAQFDRRLFVDSVRFEAPLRLTGASFGDAFICRSVDLRKSLWADRIVARAGIFALDVRASERISFERAYFEARDSDTSRYPTAFGDAVESVHLEDVACGSLSFAGSRFFVPITCRRVNCQEDFSLDGSRFDVRQELTGLTAERTISLDNMVASEPFAANVHAPFVAADRSFFEKGGELAAGTSRLSWSSASTSSPFTIRSIDQERPVQLTTLSESDLNGVVLASVDLRECRLIDTFNTSSLQFDRGCIFPRTTGWRSRRQIIFDESEARASGTNRSRFGAVAELYRALRLVKERGGDSPGSADFYYGEMEMRRAGTSFSSSASESVEAFLLWGYWFISGYGQRAWRAMMLLLTVVAGSVTALSLMSPFAPLGSVLQVVLANCFSVATGATLDPINALPVKIIDKVLAVPLVALVLFSLRSRVRR